MAKESTDYKKVLEDVRHIYKQKYGGEIDNELLYFVIRLNELQVSLCKKIEDIPRLTFKSGNDYFFYSLGKYLPFLILGIGLTLVSCFLFILGENKNLKSYEVVPDDKGTSIKLSNYNGSADTLFHLNKQQQPSLDKKPRRK